MQMTVKRQLQIIAPIFYFFGRLSLFFRMFDFMIWIVKIIHKVSSANLDTNLIELAADALLRREFFRLTLFMRLNDIRLKNWRKSKLRTVSMVDCLQIGKTSKTKRKKSIKKVNQSN